MSSSLPQYINEFQVPTSGSAPLAIAVDKNGIVWFTESNASKLGRFDPSNNSFIEYRVPGVGDMWGIGTDREGHVWVTQYAGRGSVNPGGTIVAGGNGRLLNFDPETGNFLAVNIPTNSSFPMRLVIDSEDRVWFTEFLGNKIGMYDQSSKRLAEYLIPSNESGAADLTIDRNGVLWFTEAYAQKVGELFPDNQSFIEYRLGAETPSMIVSSPVGIAVDSNGEVWVADHGGNWIVEFKPASGSVVHYPTHTPPENVYPISIPNGLLIDARSRIWFGEHGGNSIAYFDPASGNMVEFPIPTGPIATTLWIALAPDGEIWFTEWSTDKIGVLHANLQVPITMELNVNSLIIPIGQTVALIAAANITSPMEGNGTWRAFWSSYNQNDITATFSPGYPSLGGSSSTSAKISVSNSASTGNYSLSVAIDASGIIVSKIIPVDVIPGTQGNLVNQQYLRLSEVLIPTVALAIILVLRRRKLRKSKE